MSLPQSTLSSKKQITIPAEVCKKMNLKPKTKILFLEIRPGEFQLVPCEVVTSKQNFAKSLYGKYQNPNIDGVESLLQDRKEDILLEENGFLQ